MASKFEENALWLKSIETNGSLFTANTSLNGATLAARSIMAFTSSTVVSRAAMKDKSTSDTLTVGTRTAKPSNLPCNSGTTKPTAAAAPVLVGIIDSAAARARRKSVWYTSDKR